MHGMLLVIILLIVLSFAAGMRRLAWWTILIGPLGCLGVGAELVSATPVYDDLRGLNSALGIALAIVCALLWLLGRGTVAAADRGTQPRRRR